MIVHTDPSGSFDNQGSRPTADFPILSGVEGSFPLTTEPMSVSDIEENGTPATPPAEEQPTGDDSPNTVSEPEGGEQEEENKPEDPKEQAREGYAQRQAEKQAKDLSQPADTKDDALTVTDMVRQNQRLAVQQATVPSDTDSEEVRAVKQDINDNWDGVKKFYKNTSDAKIPTPEEIRADIIAAHAAFRSRNPLSQDPNQAARSISATGPSGAGKGTAPTPQQPKRVLPESKPMDQWYD